MRYLFIFGIFIFSPHSFASGYCHQPEDATYEDVLDFMACTTKVDLVQSYKNIIKKNKKEKMKQKDYELLELHVDRLEKVEKLRDREESECDYPNLILE